jgi:hypothetical protein
LTCVFLFRLLPTVHGRFRLARGFLVGWDAPSEDFLLADEHANRSRGGRECVATFSFGQRFSSPLTAPSWNVANVLWNPVLAGQKGRRDFPYTSGCYRLFLSLRRPVDGPCASSCIVTRGRHAHARVAPFLSSLRFGTTARGFTHRWDICHRSTTRGGSRDWTSRPFKRHSQRVRYS